MPVTITACANSTPPANTVIATKTVSGQDYQQFILTDNNGSPLGQSGASPLWVIAENLSGSAAGSPLFSSITNLAGSAAGSPLFTNVTNSPSVIIVSSAASPVFVSGGTSASIVTVTNLTGSAAGSPTFVSVTNLAGSAAGSPLFTSTVVTNLAGSAAGSPLFASITNSISASISNTACVIVSSGSVVVTNALSASISNSPSVIIVSSAASPVFISGGAAGGTSAADKAVYAEGTTNFTPVGGWMFNTAASLSACQSGAVRMSEWRAMYTTLRTASGNELGVAAASPLFTSVGNLAGSASGSPLFTSITNSPSVVVGSGSVVVTNIVSASITNSPSVVVSSGSMVVTNIVSASISNTACVIVSSGSLVITNLQSASISNFTGSAAGSPTFVSITNLAGSAAGSPLFTSTVVTNLAGSAAGSPLFHIQTNYTGSAAGSPTFVSVTNLAGSAAGSPLFTSTVVTNLAGSAAGSPLFVSGTNVFSASISNTACVIVNSGSLVVTNALSASISNTLTASAIQGIGACPAAAWPIVITDRASSYGMSGSPLAVAQDAMNVWWAGSLVAASQLNLSTSATGCATMITGTAGKATIVMAATFTTSSCQFIGWIASGAAAASKLVQTAMPFGTFGGMDANRMPFSLWQFPSGSNAVMTTTSACNVAGTLVYIQATS